MQRTPGMPGCGKGELMKKTVALILSILVFLPVSLSSAVSADGDTVTEGPLTFTAYDGYCVLTRCDGSAEGDIAIPGSVGFGGGKLPLKSVAAESFSGCAGVTGVIIPDGVTGVGYRAFYGCTGLESVSVPGSVSIIGAAAFEGCSALSDAAMGNGIKTIHYYAFAGCRKLAGITIPDSAEEINEYAFSGCTGLTAVVIPAGVKYLSTEAFSGCTSLESISVSDKNQVYHSENGCVIGTESKTLVLGLDGGIIPGDGSVTSIGAGAFRGRTGLECVSIPQSVTSIGGYAFDGCSGLKTVIYKGTEEQWKETDIGPCNDFLLDAVFIFSGPETGDCNEDGKVNNKDVVSLFRYVSSGAAGADPAVFDANGDGKINNKDVVALFRRVSAG